jgi:hypothetical protein
MKPKASGHKDTEEEPWDILKAYLDVYVTADKYDVPKLRERMLDCYVKNLNEFIGYILESDRLEYVIQTIYDSIPFATDPLRGCIFPCMRNKFQILRKTNATKLLTFLENFPDISSRLAIDLLESEDRCRLIHRARERYGIDDDAIFEWKGYQD